MNATASPNLITKTLAYHLYQEFMLRWRFKYVLPKVKEITLDGLRLDVSALSPKIRNRLMTAGYEAHEKHMCADFLTKDDSILEIGAAIGFIGLFCQKRLGIKNYICFEANPYTVDILKRNYDLNGVKPNVYNMALAHAEGTVDLEVGTDFWENSIVSNNPSSRGRKTVAVQAAPLPALFAKAAFKPNVLIIDIEGAEQFIDFNQIPAQVNKVIIELHPKVIGQEVTYNIVATMIQLGFRVAREEEGTFVFLRK
ncbi:MAG TPA: FkbM family methyltransferase [Methylomirabilota bacterium]|nr:FkbM family methyltransferase [Methylomirabilota bacterium]